MPLTDSPRDLRANPAEVTLGDLLAWEPRLRLASVDQSGRGVPPDETTERELTWAVTARATPPMLPPLRGGELVILPARILAEAGVELPAALLELLRELDAADVAAVVLEIASVPPRAPLPVLIAEPPPAELEGEINRLLTQRRGELYRAGTDLGRRLAGLTAAGADLETVLTAAAEVLGAAVTVHQGRDRTMAGPSERRDGVLALALAGGAWLQLGPMPPAERARMRMAAERVAVAADAALARAERERVRGPARAAALAAVIASADVNGAALAALAMPTGAGYRVALAAPAMGPARLHRSLASLGTPHEAGALGGNLAAVVELRPGANGLGALPAVLASVEGVEGSATAVPWLALSGPVREPAALPVAGREARYVAALLAAGRLPGPVARFDAIADLGAYQLLYPLWGTPGLARFVGEALGDLPQHDARGTLRRTLLALFEAGGSHVEAAHRLGIHRNTLTYRLKHIAALTGLDPADPAAGLSLHLALLAADLPASP